MEMEEIEKNGIDIDGQVHRFTFYNKADMSWAKQLAHTSGPSSHVPSSWVNLMKDDFEALLPYVDELEEDGSRRRRDAVVGFPDEYPSLERK